MKKHVLEFLKRGAAFCWGGPVILAVIYAVLGACGTVTCLSPGEAATGILTTTLMVFVAAGVTIVYQIERLSLFPALLIHGGVLYLDYLLIYLLNGWLASQRAAVLVFTAAFAAGYAVVWLCIYLIIKKGTDRMNKKLRRS